MDKRVVFEPTQGPHKGTPQIVGTLPEGTQPPEFLANFEQFGRQVEFASLIRVSPRAVLYREVSPAPRGQFGQPMRFDPRQA